MLVLDSGFELKKARREIFLKVVLPAGFLSEPISKMNTLVRYVDAKTQCRSAPN